MATGDPKRDIEQHLEHWMLAYGADLSLPPGTVVERTGLQRTVEAPAAPDMASHEPASAPETAPAGVSPAAVAPAAVASPPATPASGTAEAPKQAEADQSPTVTALRAMRTEVLSCTRCKLHQGRQNAVFGEGSPTARVMFVGEAPGAKEDESGRPFVGPAGQLLNRILEAAMGLERSEVFIANINKCRPPGNRAPEADEVAACLPFLKEQVELVQPEVLVALGRTAAQNLLGSTQSLSAMRRQEHFYNGVPVIVTWHPAYLLREPSKKRETWDDIKRVNKLLGLPEVPAPKR